MISCQKCNLYSSVYNKYLWESLIPSIWVMFRGLCFGIYYWYILFIDNVFHRGRHILCLECWALLWCVLYFLIQSTAIYQAKQKLSSINQANSKRISSEELIKYAHKISAGYAVAAPPTWQPGNYISLLNVRFLAADVFQVIYASVCINMSVSVCVLSFFI